jgi:hypothetical protein
MEEFTSESEVLEYYRKELIREHRHEASNATPKIGGTLAGITPQR